MLLKTLVTKFREAIEIAQAENEHGSYFYKFPKGQCGHTSDILCQYLLDNGFKNIYYVNGTYSEDNWEGIYSHTWLVVNELIVDITADQFKHKQPPLQNFTPVYVGPMNDFYRLFDTSHGSYHKHFGLNENWSNYSELKEWYQTILKYL